VVVLLLLVVVVQLSSAQGSVHHLGRSPDQEGCKRHRSVVQRLRRTLERLSRSLIPAARPAVWLVVVDIARFEHRSHIAWGVGIGHSRCPPTSATSNIMTEATGLARVLGRNPDIDIE
jgi:hypothetical protein